MLSQPSPTLLSAPTPARTFGPTTPARTLLAAVALLGGLFAGVTTAFSQSVTTDPVGAVSYSLSPGINPISLSLLPYPIVRGKVISVATNVIALEGLSHIGDLLTTNEPYYIEIYSGPLKGDRFEVETTLTKTSNDNTITISENSPYNTLPAATLTGNLDAASITLRRHITPAQIQALSSSPFVGNNTSSNADQILIFNPVTSGYVTYYLRSDGVTWRQAGTTTVVNKTPIPPTFGIFLRKTSTSVQLTQIGEVRINDFAVQLTEGFQLLASPWPTPLSPAKLNASQSTGWLGSNTPSNADQILIYNKATEGFDLYYLRGDGTTWRRGGSPEVVTNTDIIPANTPFFIKKASSEENYILQSQAVGL